jgi:hypothetical protein
MMLTDLWHTGADPMIRTTEDETSGTPKINVVDTSELFTALEGDSGGQKRLLERVCRLLQIKSTFT